MPSKPKRQPPERNNKSSAANREEILAAVAESPVSARTVPEKKRSGAGEQKIDTQGSSTGGPPGNTTGQKIPHYRAPERRKLGLAVGVTITVLLLAVVAGYAVVQPRSNREENRQDQAAIDGAEEPQRVPRRIDGVLDDVEDANRHPVAIMIENQTAARPQAGLDKAQVIYEALAEGGITRFLAIYTFPDPADRIGPVRSARPYYVDWARGYDAMYVHIGGSPKAESRIAASQTFDLNQFFNSQYFFRDQALKVASEHTLFTSGKYMTLALIDKKAPSTGSFTPWSFKDDAPVSERPLEQRVTIDFSTFSYQVDYAYDRETNDYVRSQAEQPHVMRDGTQLRAKNVIIVTVKRRLEQPAEKGRLEMDTIGQGPAQIVRDGVIVAGTWKKQSLADPLLLLDSTGQEILLNRGQTWVEVVPPEQEVTVR